MDMSVRKALKLLTSSWRRSLVKALIVICIAMVLASLILMGMSLWRGNAEIGEMLFVLALNIFNVFLLYSFL